MQESPQPAPLAHTPPEAEVEDRAARGRTVDKLFRDHNQDLLRFLQVKLQDEGEAREVAQEAYVRLLELDNTKVVRFLRAYLFRIAANLAIDRLNARRRMRLESGTDHAELEQVRDPLDVERSFLAVEEFELFLTCLEALKAYQRALALAVDGESPYGEVDDYRSDIAALERRRVAARVRPD